MVKVLILYGCLFILGCNSSIKENSQSMGFSESYFTDKRDNQKYKIITFNNVSWFAENLRYRGNNKIKTYCHVKDSCNYYGMLYSFPLSNDLCPDGWQMPEDADWRKLEYELGMPENQISHVGVMRGVDIEGKGYKNKVMQFGIKNSPSATIYNEEVHIKESNNIAGYWSKTENGKMYVRIFYPEQNIGRVIVDAEKDKSLFHIRCIKK